MGIAGPRKVPTTLSSGPCRSETILPGAAIPDPTLPAPPERERALPHLFAGSISDLQGRRDEAIFHCRQVLRDSEVEDAHCRVRDFMKDPFEGSLFTTGTPKDIHHRDNKTPRRLAQGVPP